MMLVHIAEPQRTFALDGSFRAPNRASNTRITCGQIRCRGPAWPPQLSFADGARGWRSALRAVNVSRLRCCGEQATKSAPSP